MRPLTLRSLSVRLGLSVFLAIVVSLAISQVWLTWRLMEQDRNLAAQRSRERLEQVADLAVAQLTSALGDWDLSLRELDALPPPDTLRAKLAPGATIILLTPHSVAAYPRQPLLFVPDPPSSADVLPRVFETAEQFEFRDQKYDRAIEALRPLAEQPVTRPEALLRIARLEKKRNQSEAALAAYARLSSETAVSSSGVPYALLAAVARCQMLAGAADPKRAAAEAESLITGLSQGRWPLRRETFEYYWAEAKRLRRSTGDPPRALLEFASLISHLYERWQPAVRSGSSSSGREVQPDSALLSWHATPARLTALFEPPGWLGSSLKLPAHSSDIRWKLLLPGAPPAGPAGPESRVLRSLADAQLAGRIEFSSASGSNHGLNRALWLGGVALMLLLVLAGAYATYRGVNRELRVGQLQTDFVSAVSHEFRSPLTTLRSLTELLAQDRLPDEAGRRRSYVFLERETTRLQRLVEDLLDFGRMQSGRKQYRMERYDLFALVRATVAEFREEALSSGFQIELDLDSRAATVEADEEALRRAIRNLLENAVKYSPECRTVWVEGTVNQHQATISVRDRGMGIEPGEQREIFQEFVRGAAAKKAGIKGTGIGLSMVRQIVEAMGGRIRLKSAAGVGSTFTIFLPLAGSEETRA